MQNAFCATELLIRLWSTTIHSDTQVIASNLKEHAENVDSVTGHFKANTKLDWTIAHFCLVYNNGFFSVGPSSTFFLWKLSSIPSLHSIYQTYENSIKLGRLCDCGNQQYRFIKNKKEMFWGIAQFLKECVIYTNNRRTFRQKQVLFLIITSNFTFSNDNYCFSTCESGC